MSYLVDMDRFNRDAADVLENGFLKENEGKKLLIDGSEYRFENLQCYPFCGAHDIHVYSRKIGYRNFEWNELKRLGFKWI